MLRRIKINNYKSFVDTEIAFTTNLVFLAGENGSGKTTLFEILDKLSKLVSKGWALASEEHPEEGVQFLGETFTRWKEEEKEKQQRFELDIEGNEGLYKYVLVVGKERKGFPRIVEEKVSFNDGTLYDYRDSAVHLYDNKTYREKVTFPCSWSRSFIPSVMDRVENEKLIWLRDWFGRFFIFQPNPWKMTGGAKGESRYLLWDLSNFASWYRNLRQNARDKDYALFICELKQALDGFEGMRFAEAGEGAKEIIVTFDKDKDYLLSELSEGQRLLISLYAIWCFWMDGHSLLCLDEPDNFLALGEICPLIDMFVEKTSDDSSKQIFLSSHHPEMYDKLPDEDGLLLTRGHDNGASPTEVRKFGEVFAKSTGLKRSQVIARGWEE